MGVTRFNTVNDKDCFNTPNDIFMDMIIFGFNTVNGKGCCNFPLKDILKRGAEFQYRKR